MIKRTCRSSRHTIFLNNVCDTHNFCDLPAVYAAMVKSSYRIDQGESGDQDEALQPRCPAPVTWDKEHRDNGTQAP